MAPHRDDPSARDVAGVVAPPPLLYAGTLILGFGLDALLGTGGIGLPTPLRWTLAGALFAAALTIAVLAIGRFHRAGTSVPPSRPATALVTDGIYAHTRNPMYVGLALLYAAMALAADAPVALVLLAPLLLVVRHGVIAREERYMAAKFGDAYERYKASVRRWI